MDDTNRNQVTKMASFIVGMSTVVLETCPDRSLLVSGDNWDKKMDWLDHNCPNRYQAHNFGDVGFRIGESSGAVMSGIVLFDKPMDAVMFKLLFC